MTNILQDNMSCFFLTLFCNLRREGVWIYSNLHGCWIDPGLFELLNNGFVTKFCVYKQ